MQPFDSFRNGERALPLLPKSQKSNLLGPRAIRWFSLCAIRRTFLRSNPTTAGGFEDGVLFAMALGDYIHILPWYVDVRSWAGAKGYRHFPFCNTLIGWKYRLWCWQYRLTRRERCEPFLYFVVMSSHLGRQKLIFPPIPALPIWGGCCSPISAQQGLNWLTSLGDGSGYDSARKLFLRLGVYSSDRRAPSSERLQPTYYIIVSGREYTIPVCRFLNFLNTRYSCISHPLRILLLIVLLATALGALVASEWVTPFNSIASSIVIHPDLMPIYTSTQRVAFVW